MVVAKRDDLPIVQMIDARGPCRRVGGQVRRSVGQGGRPEIIEDLQRARRLVPLRGSTSTPTRTAGDARRHSSTTRRPTGTSARRRSATSCRHRTRTRTGSLRRSSTAASATGWRTTSTGRCRATATGVRPFRSGAASTGTRRASVRSPSSRSCSGSDLTGLRSASSLRRRHHVPLSRVRQGGATRARA